MRQHDGSPIAPRRRPAASCRPSRRSRSSPLCVTRGPLAARPHGAEARAARAARRRVAQRARARFPRTSDWDAWRFRPVRRHRRLRCRAPDPARQRVHGGRAGYDVVTPLVLADGRVVLVERGWVAGRRDARRHCRWRRRLRATSRVTGRINLPPGGVPRARPRHGDRDACGRTSTSQRYAEATGRRACCPSSSSRRRRGDRATTWCATGPRPMSAWRSTESTWCSGSPSRPLAIGFWAVLHVATQASDDAATPRARRGRRTLILIALVAVAPVVASYAAYYLFPRDSRSTTASSCRSARRGRRTRGGKPSPADFSGQVGARGGGAAAHATRSAPPRSTRTRQARTIQGREMDRIARVWLVTDDARACRARSLRSIRTSPVRARDARGVAGRAASASTSSIRSATSCSRGRATRTSRSMAARHRPPAQGVAHRLMRR